MAKPELGTKRTCVSCSTKFYDLTRAPAVCPRCGTEQPAEQPRLRRALPASAAVSAGIAAAAAEEKLKKRAAAEGAGGDGEADDIEVDDADAAEGVEDAEELDDAEDDLGEDIGVGEEGEEEA